jgi:hypothetical protein
MSTTNQDRKRYSKDYDFGINESIQYDINEDKKTVTAQVDCSILSTFKDPQTLVVLTMYSYLPIHKTRHFIGVARCKDDDVFDIEVGKRVARLKLLKSIKRTQLNTLNAVKSHLTNSITQLNIEGEKVAKSRDNIVEYIRRC